MPDFRIPEDGALARASRSAGYERFAAVAAAIRALPFGRVSDGASPAAVLHERKGTCSSKHRFLAALAHECDHAEVKLALGLYEMSEHNTPGVGEALRVEGLSSILEAHCYLLCDGERFDFTGLPTGATSPLDALIEERIVSPADLPSVKGAYHRAALEAWARARGMDPHHAWRVRERCVARLAMQ